MNIKFGLSIVTAATLFCIATYVSAQMQLNPRLHQQYFYNPRSSSSQGHSLDRNPMVGSDGRNYSSASTYGRSYLSGETPGQYNEITRTRGLGAFHGNAPTISDTLNNQSRTFGTNRFDQQAVSVSDVLQGGAAIYRPQDAPAYYGQGETVMTAGQAVRANLLNVAPIPGNSNVTVDIARQNNMNQLAEDMSPLQYKQVATQLILQDTPYGYQVATSAPGTLPAPTNAQDVLQLQQALDRLGYAQGAFGLTNPYDRTALTNEINKFDQEDEQADQRAGMIDTRIDNGPISTGNPIASIDQNPITGKPLVRDDFLYREEPKEQSVTDVPSNESTPLPTQDSMGFNQDAFQELVTALRQKAIDEKNAKEKQRKEELEKESTELDKVLNKDSEKDAGQEDINDLSLTREREARRQMIVTLDTKHDVVLKNLAGNSKDLFNRYMNNAKHALAKGRYYAASQQYELAALSNPNKNPLPWLGGSLAKFAACEWSVAGFRLKTALEMYPQLMDVKLDLKTLLPALDVQQQLNLLENWLMAMEPQQNVLLLAAYMQYQVGNTAGARRHAEAIMKYSQKVDPIIRKVAEEIIAKTNTAKEK